MKEPKRQLVGIDLFSTLRPLYRQLSSRRRIQLLMVFVLILVGAVAELATIASVIPFLALISASEQGTLHPAISFFFGQVGDPASEQMALWFTIVFMGIVLIACAVRLLLAWASQKLVFRIGHDLSAKVYHTALYKPFAYHAATNSSDIISAITKAQMAAVTILLPVLSAVTGLIISFTLISALFAIDAGITIAVTASFGLTYLVISYLTKNRLERNGQKIALAQTERIRAVQEGLGGIRDIVMGNAQEAYLKRFAAADLAFQDARAFNTFIGTGPRFVIESASILFVALLAFVLSGQAGGLVDVLPLLGSFALAGQRILPAMHSVFQSWTQIRGNHKQLQDVLDLIQEPIHPLSRSGSVVVPLPFKREIVLGDLSYRYHSGDPLVLDNVNLTIQRGSRIGFIGKTGSGKSTIVDLIMGLLEPVSGHITVDGEALTSVNRARWQANIAHVSQHVYLADASVAENIAFGLPPEDIDHDLVKLAARRAAMSDFVETLPDGYRTRVGERGARLSGGQRQRIGIARAAYRQAKVLVLDEATSALDPETEVEVMEAIQSLGDETTVLIIAHRTSTVAGCDQIYRMKSGKVLPYELAEH